MNTFLKAITWLVGIGVLVWIGYAVWQTAPVTPAKAPVAENTEPAVLEPIKVGVIGPFTGDAAVYGEPMRNMIAIAVQEVNAAGGVNGAPIEAMYEDGKCNGKDGANAAQKLVNVDGVKMIIGGFCSSESLAAIPIAEAAKVVVFSPGSSSPELTGKSNYFFRNYPSDSSQGKVLAEAAYNLKKWKKVTVIQEQTDYALGVYKSFSQNFEKLGGQKAVKEEFPSTATDFRSILTKLRAAKADALLVATQTPAAAERVFKQINDLKWKPALMVDDAISGDPKTVANNKALLEGALTAEFGFDSANPKFQQMIQSYKTRYGAEPPYQSYMQTVYDSVYMMRDALLANGNDGEKIAAWSRTINNWQGASGSVTIGPDGDRVGGHRLEVIKNGKVEAYQ